jgi:hypothetical protein
MDCEKIHLDSSSSEEVSSDNKLKLSLRDVEEERVQIQIKY